MANIDSFIFDLDGTLLDTLLDIKEAVNYSLRFHYLKKVSKEEILDGIGHGSIYLIKHVLNDDNLNLFDSVFNVYYKYYEEHFNVYTKPYDGLLDVLKYSKDKGIKLFIFTNKPYEITNSLVSYHFKDLFLKVVSIKKDSKTVKPDPTLFFKETEEFNIDYQNSYYFGDSEVDILTSRNLNISNMVSVTYGYKDKEFLKTYSPKYMIDEPKSIFDIINK